MSRRESIIVGEHGGYILTDEHRAAKATCRCGFKGPQRQYRYQANQDLLTHLRERGTLPPDPTVEDFERAGDRHQSTLRWVLPARAI